MYGFNPLKAIQIKFWLLLCSLTFDSTQMKGESKVKPHSDFHTCWCVAFCFLKKSQSAITVRDAVISCWFLPHAWLGSDLVQAFKKGEPLIALDTQKRGPFFCIRGTLPQGYTHTHTDDPPHTHTPDTPYTHTHTHTQSTHTQRYGIHTHTHTQINSRWCYWPIFMRSWCPLLVSPSRCSTGGTTEVAAVAMPKPGLLKHTTPANTDPSSSISHIFLHLSHIQKEPMSNKNLSLPQKTQFWHVYKVLEENEWNFAHSPAQVCHTALDILLISLCHELELK